MKIFDCTKLTCKLHLKCFTLTTIPNNSQLEIVSLFCEKHPRFLLIAQQEVARVRKNNYNHFVRAADGEVLNTSSVFFIMSKHTCTHRVSSR